MDEQVRELLKYGVVLLVLVSIFFGGTYLLRSLLGTRYPMMVVVSQSMVPKLGVGDFIVVGQIQNFAKVDAGPPPEGDILVFLREGYREEYIVHRAVERHLENGQWFYVTKGDNNAFPDPQPVSETQVVGRVIGRVPIMGYFSLFIKTLRGFGLVIVAMMVSFFFDYILPDRRGREERGSFPWLALTPYLLTLITIASFWINPGNNLRLELVSVAAWYTGCFLLPLAFWDDDMGLMVWLYHLVLVMIPIACDIVWWTTDITPSMWWSVQGSTLPITWLLMEETRYFHRTFTIILMIILPGSFIYLATTLAKRYEVDPFSHLSMKLRDISRGDEIAP
ncbi:MAG: signal peptidase I [Candidatus Bathyarchaeia archaeon]